MLSTVKYRILKNKYFHKLFHLKYYRWENVAKMTKKE